MHIYAYKLAKGKNLYLFINLYITFEYQVTDIKIKKVTV